MGTKRFDLVVAGAGIMGLGSALEAARRGQKTAVFSPVDGDHKASWAAAGILVTRDARVTLSAFREFYVRSIGLYPGWLEEISRLSGKPVSLHRQGDYLIYDREAPDAEADIESRRGQLQREHAERFEESDRLPPFLAAHSPLRHVKVFRFPDEAYVNNRELLDALRAACLRLGVTFLDGAPATPWQYRDGATRLDFTAGRASGSGGMEGSGDRKASGYTVEAGQVLIAAGAWSSDILAAHGIEAPLIPVKGQMMRIPRPYPENSMVHFGEDLYLVPRGDALVVGATTEPGRWEESFDEKGEAQLGASLHRLLPQAGGPLETWAGLRPRTKDRLPWMGWVDAGRGWALCTGHYKCGISMAPLAVQSVLKLMNGEKPGVDLGPFDPWRKKGLQKKSS